MYAFADFVLDAVLTRRLEQYDIRAAMMAKDQLHDSLIAGRPVRLALVCLPVSQV
jgi:hypothetical protein